MSTPIEINGNGLVPLKEAARKIAYSRDYLAKLARDKKITATHVGRQWFVDMHSLNAFLNETALEQEVRNLHLSEERRRELLAKKKLEKLTADMELAKSAASAKSFLVATMVLFLGLFTGVVLSSSDNVTTNLNYIFSANTFMAKVINDKAAPAVDQINKAEHTVFSDVNEYPLFVDEAEIRPMTGTENGIVLFTEGGQIKNKEQIQQLFSDEVQVQFSEPGQGIVIYTNEKNENSQMPFLIIPENKTASESPKDPSL